MGDFSVYSSILQLTRNAESKADNIQNALEKGNMSSGDLMVASLEVGREDSKLSMFMNIMQKVWSSQDKIYGMTG